MKKLYILIALVNMQASLQAALEAFNTRSTIAVDNLTPNERAQFNQLYKDEYGPDALQLFEENYDKNLATEKRMQALKSMNQSQSIDSTPLSDAVAKTAGTEPVNSSTSVRQQSASQTTAISPTQTPEEERADALYAMDYGDDALDLLRTSRAKAAAQQKRAAADFATAASEVVDSQANNAFDRNAQVASVSDAPKASASKGSTQKGTDGTFQKAPSDAMSKSTAQQSQDRAKSRGQAADKTEQQSDKTTAREQSASDGTKKKGFFSKLFGGKE